MNALLTLLLVSGQAEPPPPATEAAPVIELEGTTSTPAAPAPAPAAPAKLPLGVPAPVPNLAPGTRGGPVYLTIHSNRPDLLLIREDNEATQCTTPCNALVPAGPQDKYFLGGKGLTNSDAFDLAEGIKAARIDVRAGTKAGKVTGIILTAIGIPWVYSGGLSLIAYGVLQDPWIQGSLGQNGSQAGLISSTLTLTFAIVELVAGAIMSTIGLILWPMSPTRMTITPVELPPDFGPEVQKDKAAQPEEAPPPASTTAP